MFKRIVRRVFHWLPPLQESLRQSYANPLQRDRLPAADGVELEFPVVAGSLKTNRAIARNFLIIAFAIVFAFALANRFEVFKGFLPAVTVSLGAALVVTSYLSVRRHRFRWLLLIIGLPHLLLALMFIPLPMFRFALAALMIVFVSDLFATHYFHLQTTAPLDRTRALQLRRLWRGRFGLLRAVAGVELYIVAIALLFAVPAIFVWWNLQHPPTIGLLPYYRVSLMVGALMVLPLVIEAIAAFLYRRRMISIRQMLSQLGSPVMHWLTYNRSAINAPGAYQTPAGSCRHRRRMSLGLLLMVTGVMSPILNQPWDDQIDSLTAGVAAHETAADAAQERRLSTPPKSATRQDTEPQLEPYQQRMLERMPEAERQAYLARLKEQQQSAVPESGVSSNADSTSAPPPSSQTTFQLALETFYSILFLLVFPASAAVLTLGLLIASTFPTTGRLVGRYGSASHVTPDETLSSATWEKLVDRVQNSQDEQERESLLLGVNASDNTPVLVPRAVFTEHAHLLGDSGSGKTSIGISSIISQLIRPGNCSLVLLDLKGDDLALFQGLKHDADNAGLRFRWFTNLLEHSTYAFNPLTQRSLQRMTLYQKTDTLTTAMGLQYGRDYGRAYYSDANARLLHAAIKSRPGLNSFRELAEVLSNATSLPKVDAELRKAASHLVAIVDRLADSEPLNVTNNGDYSAGVLDNRIEFTDVVSEAQVVHFHLTSTIGTTSTAEVARIALYSLLTAAAQVPPEKRIQTFLVIDEFQRIISGNVELLLQLARSLNIGVILANQSLLDLRSGGIDLIPAISANTRFRQVFAASNLEEQESLVRGSGESIAYSQSWQDYLGLSGIVVTQRGLSEFITPRLRINDILLATDHPLQSIVQIRRGAGYAQYGGMPFVLQSTHPITFEEFTRRKKITWPEANDETLVPQIQEHESLTDFPGLRPKRRGNDLFVDDPPPPDSGAAFLEELYRKQNESRLQSEVSKTSNSTDETPKPEEATGDD